jgi:hypothetical protein
MNAIRIPDLLGMSKSRQHAELLDHRPESSDSRMQWWLSVVDQIISELVRAQVAGRRSSCLSLALDAVILAYSEGDLSSTNAVVVLADLGSRVGINDVRPPELSPEQIARRAIRAISIDRTRVSEVVARERKFLLEDERAWNSSEAGESIADIEFDHLDDLRRILTVLDQLVPAIDNESLRQEVEGWLAFKDLIQHGPEIGARGRELLLKKQENEINGIAPEDPFYGGPVG